MSRKLQLGVATAAIAFFAAVLMVLSAGPSSAVQVAYGMSPDVTGPYEVVASFNPEFATNASVSSTLIGSSESYSTTTGSSTTWEEIPGIVDSYHTQNSTTFPTTGVVAPGGLQDIPVPGDKGVTGLPGYVGSSDCGLGISKEQAALCHSPFNTTMGWTAFSSNDQGATANATLGNTTENGQTAFDIGFNSSTATASSYAYGGASLYIPEYAIDGDFNLPSGNDANNVVSVAFQLSEGGGVADDVAAGFAVGNGTYGAGTLPFHHIGEGPLGPSLTDSACTTSLPYCASDGGYEVYETGVASPTLNESSDALVSPGLNSENIAPQPWTLSDPENSSGGVDVVGQGQSAFVSESLADLGNSPQAGFNTSTPDSLCTVGVDVGCMESGINLIFWFVLQDTSPSKHFTLTITAIDLTTSPISLGTTYHNSATSYKKPDGTPCAGVGNGGTNCVKSTGVEQFTYDNTTSTQAVLGPYASPGVTTSAYVGAPAVSGWFAPSWGNTGWVNASGGTETTFASGIYASSIQNATETANGNQEGGVVTILLPMDYPSAPSISYGEAYLYDTVHSGVTYDSVTAGTGGQEQSVYTGSPESPVAPGTRVMVPSDWFGEHTCDGSPCGDGDVFNENVTAVLGLGSTFCDETGPLASGCANGGGTGTGNTTGVGAAACGGDLTNICTYEAVMPLWAWGVVIIAFVGFCGVVVYAVKK